MPYPFFECCASALDCDDDEVCTIDSCLIHSCHHQPDGVVLYPLDIPPSYYHFQSGTTDDWNQWMIFIPDRFDLYVSLYPATSRLRTWISLPPVILPEAKPSQLQFQVSMGAVGYLCSNNTLHVLIDDTIVDTFSVDDAEFARIPVVLDLTPWAGQAISVTFEFDSHDCLQVNYGHIDVRNVRVISPECSP